MDGLGLTGKGEPIEHRFVSGGTQNEIYEIRRGDLHCAMRIPPPSAPAGRDDGIYREWRIIEALDGTDVPHTEAVAMCTDTSVLGRAFYLMGFVDGVPVRAAGPLRRGVRPSGRRHRLLPHPGQVEARRHPEQGFQRAGATLSSSRSAL